MVLQNSIATIRNLSFHPEVKAALMEAGAMYGSPLTPPYLSPIYSHSFQGPCAAISNRMQAERGVTA
jgi:hypothetical protein